MAQNKDRWRFLRNPDHFYFLPFVIVATSIVALWLLFISHSSVLNWVKAAVEVKRQEIEMARLNAEMDQMDREIENLSQNRDSIEAYAREHYRFAAPGDDVYIIE